MSILGNVRIGQKAPDFHCEAVISGAIKEVSLSTFIHPNIRPGAHKADSPWLILLFIPAAFSFVCPTEVLAFQNHLDDFKDHNCSVVFVSVDTKHSLWQWQNVPRQFGGLGMIDIPLLSDATHRLSRDYGVLIEDEGISLRGMFIIDGEGVVQQITLNNVTVGRSVVEALRLLEAFQVVAKHGVLCPVDWKPTGDAADTLSTISNLLTESYEERLANLQNKFAGIEITDPEAKHKPDEDSTSPGVPNHRKSSASISYRWPSVPSLASSQAHSTPPTSPSITIMRSNLPSAHHYEYLTRPPPSTTQTYLSPPSSHIMPSLPKPRGHARHTRGQSTTETAPPGCTSYETRSDSHVVLEFDELTVSLQGSPAQRPQRSPAQRPPMLMRANTWTAGGGAGEQTRFQATFEALKKMGGGSEGDTEGGE